MKRGELAAAIRTAKGNPLMQVTLPGSAVPINLGIMKMMLLEQLDVAFPESKVQETGLAFDPDTMMLSFDDVQVESSTEEQPTTGLDDLF